MPAAPLAGVGFRFSGRSVLPRRRLLLLVALWLGAAGAGPARAALQFDPLLGFDKLVPEASWFPFVFEIKNDGPSFAGVVEITPGGGFGQGQVRRLAVELPTGTLKRLCVPMFGTVRGFATWDVRLVDERGRVRAEERSVQATRQAGAGAAILGAMARTSGGTPTLRTIPQGVPQDIQPVSARLQLSLFPDNPLVLEALRCIYLNSTAAADLKENQVRALYGWLNAGGHLIIGVEQISDITSTPWLRSLFPVELREMRFVGEHRELQAWLASPVGTRGASLRATAALTAPNRRRPAYVGRPAPETAAAAFTDVPTDQTFEGTNLLLAVGALREGRVLVGGQEGPLIVTANRGQGQVTALLFSPEREPVRSWKNLSTFWTKLADVPADVYAAESAQAYYTGASSDAIFGAMLDTRQVHKLPVGWLLLLLLVYLVVIGPLDQFWLKKINRPMLTWITFPCYVVLFSLLIYFIGYKLRAGESEWNELHLVDVLLDGDHAQLRGHTYASVYSPSNQRYLLESQQKYATLRDEYAGGVWHGNQASERLAVWQQGDTFKAEIFVPVWTSRLLVSDWWHSGDVPVSLSVAVADSGWDVKVANHTDHDLTRLQLVVGEHVVDLGELDAGRAKNAHVGRGQGMPLTSFVSSAGSGFQGAVAGRHAAFGGYASGRIDDLPGASLVASFLPLLGERFLSPPGLDVTPVVERGNALLFAWAPNYSPVPRINQFRPRRFQQNTMWRVACLIK